jgi:Zn-dependent peptidase ImmA (M78 family)
MPANRPFRLKMAKQKGEAFVRDENITALPIDAFKIAKSGNIVVWPKPDTAGGVSGMLLRHGNQFGILYATHIKSEGFQRFSVGHELGHYFLEGHLDHVLKNGIHESHAGFIADDPYEQEADQFAAGLLMPGNLFKKELGRHRPGLETVEAMHILCKTSLTATASRYAELTEDAAAIVISTGQNIDYCIMSETLKALPKLSWIKKGSPVPAGTATARFNSNMKRVADSDREEDEIDIRDWLGGTRSATANEQALGLGSYGKTLTVLTCPSVQDETYANDDGDDDESLMERWTPRFRR